MADRDHVADDGGSESYDDIDRPADTTHDTWLQRMARLDVGPGSGRELDLTSGKELDPGAEAARAATEEHRVNVARLRLTTGYSLAVWVAGAPVDYVSATSLFDADPVLPLTIRLVSTPLLALLYLRLRRQPAPSPRLLVAIDVSIFATWSAALGWMSVLLGGLASPYKQGVYMLLMFRGAFLAQHWRRAWPPYAAIVVAYFGALLVAASARPVLWERVQGMEGVGWLGGALFSMVAASALMIAGSHSAWSLRKQVFESQKLGKYKLLNRIGEGGHGEVWRAQHRDTQGYVAVKVLKGRFAPTADQVARFEREVRAAVSLSHPHIVRVYDYGVSEGGIYYFAMELLDGETLSDTVRRTGPLDVARATSLARQLASALADVHRLGIVHRDVKPGNILLVKTDMPSDFAKLLDFGIARWDTNERALTMTGRVLGTPGYIAPEVAQGTVSARADVYALGAVVHFALHGEVPGADVLSESSCPDNESRLQAVVRKCLARDPEERYRDALEVAGALERCASS